MTMVEYMVAPIASPPNSLEGYNLILVDHLDRPDNLHKLVMTDISTKRAKSRWRTPIW